MSVKRPYVREAEYEQIKLMQNAKLTVVQVTKVTKRSYHTINRIFKSKDFKDYKEIQRAVTIAREAPKPSIKEAERPVEDTALILQRLGNIENSLKTLTEIFRDKEAKANVAFWKR